MDKNKAKFELLMSRLKGADKEQIEAIAEGIADKVVSGVTLSNTNVKQELKDLFSSLALDITILSKALNEQTKQQLSQPKSTGVDKLLEPLNNALNREVVASLTDKQIATIASSVGSALSQTVSKLNLELAKNNLATDTVIVKNLEPMLNKLVDKIPDKIEGKVTLAYNRNAAKDYVNVRLTNGQAFIDSIAQTVSRGPGLPLISVGGVMSLPVVNPDGTPISGASDPRTGYLYSDSATVGTTDYVGKIKNDGSWFVMRIDLNDSADYVAGTDIADYTHGSGFGAWADALTGYDSADVIFAVA